MWAGSPEPGWSIATNLAHLAVYEERLAAPVIEDLAAGGDGTGPHVGVPAGGEGGASGDAWLLAGAIELAEAPLDAVLERLRTARRRQIAAVRAMDLEALNAPRTPLWQRPGSPRDSAGWVAAKTVQHTWEHGTTIFQIALFAPRP